MNSGCLSIANFGSSLDILIADSNFTDSYVFEDGGAILFDSGTSRFNCTLLNNIFHNIFSLGS